MLLQQCVFFATARVPYNMLLQQCVFFATVRVPYNMFLQLCMFPKTCCCNSVCSLQYVVALKL